MKNHPWLSKIDWESFSARKITPYYVPEEEAENFDQKAMNDDWNDEGSE